MIDKPDEKKPMIEKLFDFMALSKVMSGIVGLICLTITLLLIFGGGWFFIILALIDVYDMIKNDTVTLVGIIWAALLFGLRGIFVMLGTIFFGFLAFVGLSIAFDS